MGPLTAINGQVSAGPENGEDPVPVRPEVRENRFADGLMAAAGLGGSSASEISEHIIQCRGAVRAPEVGLVFDPNLDHGRVQRGVSRDPSGWSGDPGGIPFRGTI